MALAYATDLATGHSRDFALRSCVLGMRFADVAKLDQDVRRRIYHQALLRYIGCNADTHLLAAHWGDEITLRRELHHIDMGNRAEFVELMVRTLKRKFAGAPPEELEEAVQRGLAEGPQVNIPILSGHCEVAQRIAERIGLPEDIRESLGPNLRAMGRQGTAARPLRQHPRDLHFRVIRRVDSALRSIRVIIVAAIAGLWIISLASLAVTLPLEFWAKPPGDEKPS